MSETWKDIIGYEGLYQISNCGRVKRSHYTAGTTIHPKQLKEKEVTVWVDTWGYLRVHLNHRGVRKAFRVHRLVAQAFIPNPSNLPQVNHIDGNKSNNKVSNLEWCTNIYNQEHARKTGLRKMGLTEEEKAEVYHKWQSGKSYRTLAKEYGVCHSTIQVACQELSKFF